MSLIWVRWSCLWPGVIKKCIEGNCAGEFESSGNQYLFFTLKIRLPRAARKLSDKSITLCIKNFVHASLIIINHSTLIVFSSLTKKGKMNRLAVISIVLSVLTIQASGKSYFIIFNNFYSFLRCMVSRKCPMAVLLKSHQHHKVLWSRFARGKRVCLN